MQLPWRSLLIKATVTFAERASNLFLRWFFQQSNVQKDKQSVNQKKSYIYLIEIDHVEENILVHFFVADAESKQISRFLKRVYAVD